MFKTICYLALLTVLPIYGRELLQVTDADVGIKMCRLRNCTIAEDMRPSLARGGFSINSFGWFGLRTLINSRAFYQSLVARSQSTQILRQKILHGGQAVTQLLFQENVLYPQIQVSPYTLVKVSGRFTEFPQIRNAITTTAPDSMFYVMPEQKTQQQKVFFQQSTSDLVLTIVPEKESNNTKRKSVAPSPFQQVQNNSSVFQNPTSQPELPAPPGVSNIPASPNNVSPDLQVCIATPTARINATDQLSTLYKALQAANLVEFLSNPQVLVTLFAPTDTAFESLLNALGGINLNQLLENTQLVTAILLLHIVPDFALSESQLQSTRVLSTLLPNQDLTIGLSSTEEQFQEVTTIIPPQVAASANILVPDVPACESIIHVIDGVFLGSTDDTLVARSAGVTQYFLNPEVCKSFPPCCDEYALKVGEIDCDVANIYEIDCEQFRDLNDISEDDDLQAGDLLQIC
eukprot:TRINITY_DN665_c1_g1_i1.p1 TRINITY_DN665_c1_g1~~TRINITY_DN665_c1_g1_i1.p1  ORF type:complete len:461 (+),score=36.33 TRINITY_DN665_c1_g1_i1:87-1469(+)